MIYITNRKYDLGILNMINTINQNNTNNFNFSAYIKSTFGSDLSSNKSDIYYAKKGEPTYQVDMDTDEDGIITFDEFRTYCKDNNISGSKMAEMLKLRMTYQMTKNDSEPVNKIENIGEKSNYTLGNLDLIYAEENDSKYEENMDTDGDSKISYKEYLRYCEKNARTEAKNSDTKIRENDKSKFMTVSYGKITNAYNKVEAEVPEGKVEGIA